MSSSIISGISPASPAVCNLAFVKYGNEELQAGNNIQRDGAQDVEEPEDVAIESNLDLIISADSCESIKVVELTIHYLLNPLPGLRNVAAMLSKYGETWGTVTSLAIYFHANKSMLSAANTDVMAVKQDIEAVVLAITELFPNVLKLKYVGRNSSPVVIELCSQMAGVYSGNLDSFDSEIPIMLEESQEFSQLSNMKIHVNGDVDYKIPRTFPFMIDSLEVNTSASNISWKSFNIENSGDEIVFEHVEYLKLTFGTDDNPEAPVSEPAEITPYFPNLKYLDVSTTSHNCQFLCDFNCSELISQFDICAPKAVYEMITEHCLPDMNNMNATVVVHDEAGIKNICRPINTISYWGVAIITSVRLCGPGVQPELGDLMFIDLRSLSIDMAVDAKILMGVINSIPMLQHLEVKSLVIDDIPQEMAITDDGSPKAPTMKPANTSLKHLQVNFSCQSNDVERALSVAKYILLKCHHIEVLHAAPVTIEMLSEFVELYRPKYSHLSHIGRALRVAIANRQSELPCLDA